MQIVIDIPDEMYMDIKEEVKIKVNTFEHISFLHEVISVGTPLPKGHGRLIDADKAIYEINEMKVQGETSIMAVNLAKVLIRGSKTVIKADKTESEREEVQNNEIAGESLEQKILKLEEENKKLKQEVRALYDEAAEAHDLGVEQI